jgi:PKD repeat protein
LSRYTMKILADSPATYWRLGEMSGNTLADTAAGDDLMRQSGVTLGAAGVVADETNTAATFSGTSSGTASITTSRYAPETFSIETWFRTTTNRGGQLIGWGTSQTGNSGSTDRKLYLDNSGRLFFGVNPGARRTINSTATYRDGQWHHAAATLGSDGTRLYVDGSQVAANSAVASAQYLTGGYWRLGGDNLNGWPSAPSSNYFSGSLDETATYRTVLTGAQVSAHHSARNPALPVPSFTESCTGRACAFDGAASVSDNGPIVGYTWDFGDGSSATGVTASHTYGAEGSYLVRLTVTDSSARTASTTRQVSVTNAAPTAEFTVSCTARTCAVDSSASTDPDGTLASSEWDFGDGATDTGTMVSHSYAADGSYPIRLTVTDDSGASATLERQVTVTGAAPIAAFTASCTDLTCTVDASSTQAGTAPITGYSWDFGDGGTGSGVATTHTYSTSGVYTVTLTVTDADGKTGSTTRTVTVLAPMPPGTLASDGFVRGVTAGWGSADVGGAWTTTSTPASYAVAGGSGTMTVPTAGATRSAMLGSVSASDVDETAEASLSTLPSTGSTYLYLVARQTASNTDYRARVRIGADGSVRLAIVARSGSTTDTIIGTESVISGLALTPGTAINVRLQAVGSTPTTLQAKVWAAGDTEPSTWQKSVTDSTAAQQGAGSIGLAVTVSASNTAVPLTATFGSFLAVEPQ